MKNYFFKGNQLRSFPLDPSLLLILLLIFASTFSSQGQAKCFLLKDKPELLSKDLVTKTYKRIVFFASWCSVCGKHLKEEKISNHQTTLYIASYDKIEAAEQVMSALNIQGLCLVDADGILSKKWEVSSLPYEKVL